MVVALVWLLIDNGVMARALFWTTCCSTRYCCTSPARSLFASRSSYITARGLNCGVVMALDSVRRGSPPRACASSCATSVASVIFASLSFLPHSLFGTFGLVCALVNPLRTLHFVLDGRVSSTRDIRPWHFLLIETRLCLLIIKTYWSLVGIPELPFIVVSCSLPRSSWSRPYTRSITEHQQMVKLEIDTFSGYKIYPSKGKLFVRGDGKVNHLNLTPYPR